MIAEQTLTEHYIRVRAHSEAICLGLETEDYVVQPIADVSPPKWHLGHTTWFWETFVLVPNAPNYRIFHEDFSYVFNSYYETIGKRVLRTDRGNLSRPTVAGVYAYRAYVDEHMSHFLNTSDLSPDLYALIQLGLNHEQQHQELLITDIKYILGHNPLFPAIDMPLTNPSGHKRLNAREERTITIPEGIYSIGHQNSGPDAGSFYFDNELARHKVYLNKTTITNGLTTNGEYLAFMEAGGYQNFRYWLSDGWAWVKNNGVQAPLYWHKIDGEWWNYSFAGLAPVDLNEPVCHVSQYEADAYARWTGQRLPTEFEWEAAAAQLSWGARWEWTNSAYLPYPGFTTAEGAVGEYNGKFMSGQIVLRGASVATPEGHSRSTYRNFFQPDKRWQFTGIRLIVE
ncbi:ergothioneine biosynthesis protein EgtB [Spirosoma endbachense]|uniref:Ergothioneine biosynthesis protein EgtB n=1 Tax=Spirosoma endbachense TaxID=2666025 RepID=A0A6P1W0L8_9BACT|nr:ergothioneine biosynthesis protein EgtB [Spirosoma endbachense]QHV98933.1 ergothioneine biosynthesis protein EgtB [Spirosoma endbachense]